MCRSNRCEPWDPDVIIVTDAGLRGRRDAAIRPGPRSPRCATAACISRRRCRSAGSIAPPSGNRLIGLWWLAKTLYPDLFKEDLRELTRDFYTKFYHVTPTDPRIDYVLAGKA